MYTYAIKDTVSRKSQNKSERRKKLSLTSVQIETGLISIVSKTTKAAAVVVVDVVVAIIVITDLKWWWCMQSPFYVLPYLSYVSVDELGF